MKQLPEFLEEINQLMCDGNLDLASKQLRTRIKSEPDNCLLRKMLGDLLYLQGQVKEAITIFEKIIRKNPKFTAALYGLGIAYYRAGNLLLAIEQFEKIIAINPSLAMAFYWLGISYRHLGEEEKSIAAYRKLIELSPDSEIANYHLAGVYMFKKNYREAAKYLSQLAKISSENAEVFYRLGLCPLRLCLWRHIPAGDPESLHCHPAYNPDDQSHPGGRFRLSANTGTTGYFHRTRPAGSADHDCSRSDWRG